jgi:hypothetical protein
LHDAFPERFFWVGFYLVVTAHFSWARSRVRWPVIVSPRAEACAERLGTEPKRWS